jgi:hypothetical protein
MAATTCTHTFVIHAKAGTQSALALGRNCYWVPAFAGMTKEGEGQ